MTVCRLAGSTRAVYTLSLLSLLPYATVPPQHIKRIFPLVGSYTVAASPYLKLALEVSFVASRMVTGSPQVLPLSTDFLAMMEVCPSVPPTSSPFEPRKSVKAISVFSSTRTKDGIRYWWPDSTVVLSNTVVVIAVDVVVVVVAFESSAHEDTGRKAATNRDVNNNFLISIAEFN